MRLTTESLTLSLLSSFRSSQQDGRSHTFLPVFTQPHHILTLSESKKVFCADLVYSNLHLVKSLKYAVGLNCSHTLSAWLGDLHPVFFFFLPWSLFDGAVKSMLHIHTPATTCTNHTDILEYIGGTGIYCRKRHT